MENKENKSEELGKKLSGLTLKDKREDTRVKFLINVPVGVTSEMSQKAESHYENFLNLLSEAFTDEDKFRFEDVAVVFGLNAKKSDEDIVIKEFSKNFNSEINFRKFMFVWSGTEEEKVPYQVIREYIKVNKDTKELVRHLRKGDAEAKIYFCFFDADTVDFNGVLSSYIDIIIEKNYPTVMSTGYLFPEGSEFRQKSVDDRKVRIITAEHFPLGTYYPEPNFCLLLPDECTTLPESFICKDKHYNMESPSLIRKVKKRKGFSAVFAGTNAIITESINKQFHTNPRTWAISAYAHRELRLTEKYKNKRLAEKCGNRNDGENTDLRKLNGEYYSVLMGLLESDEEAQRIENRNPFEGPGAQMVYKAAKAVRRLKSKIAEANIEEYEEEIEECEEESEGEENTNNETDPEWPDGPVKNVVIKELAPEEPEE